MSRWIVAYLRQHGVLHIAMLLIVLLLGANMAAVPLVTQAIARIELDNQINNTTDDLGNVLLTGRITDADVAALDEALGDLVTERMHVRNLAGRGVQRGHRFRQPSSLRNPNDLAPTLDRRIHEAVTSPSERESIHRALVQFGGGSPGHASHHDGSARISNESDRSSVR